MRGGLLIHHTASRLSLRQINPLFVQIIALTTSSPAAIARYQAPGLSSTHIRLHMSSPPPINPDNTLNKFPPPTPSTPLAIAASTGDLAALRAAAPGTLSSPDASDNTPLVWAASAGQTEAADFLVNSGVDVNHRGFLGNTALSRAARGGHVETLRVLIASPSIDPNIGNEKKQFPMHFAAFKKQRECVRVLLDSGKCDLTVLDRKGRTPDQDTSDEEIRAMILKARVA
ncbi:ankyrin repeat-containing domain protein [Baffinella frigidus]|nr:ankyrin repeat-containing domain protein [Cryptophyta sp. CCMP2293]